MSSSKIDPVVDSHCTIGVNRSLECTAEDLLRQMDAQGVDRALIAPGEGFIAVRNREGNRLVADAAKSSDERLIPYAVASPWLGGEAIDVLAEASAQGARALKLDPALQGFDLLDGQVDPLIDFAHKRGWPVYVRTGTPPHALPLPLALLARRFSEVDFVMGRSGATDFWLDVVPALTLAPNLFADTAATFWDLGLKVLVDTVGIGSGRIIFSSDTPFGALEQELANVAALPVADADRAAILGGTITLLLSNQRSGERGEVLSSSAFEATRGRSEPASRAGSPKADR